jgi:Flp pilus assembly pilin Flp
LNKPGRAVADGGTADGQEAKQIVNVILQQSRLAYRAVRGARDEGQDMVEYALLVGLLSVFALAVIILVGPTLVNTFQTVVNGLGLA